MYFVHHLYYILIGEGGGGDIIVMTYYIVLFDFLSFITEKPVPVIKRTRMKTIRRINTSLN